MIVEYRAKTSKGEVVAFFLSSRSGDSGLLDESKMKVVLERVLEYVTVNKQVVRTDLV